jgi:branched-chain amino acid transport system substrate-binding protein
LVEDVHVPAVIGFSSGHKLIQFAGSLLIPNQVLVLASLTTHPQITRLPQPANLARLLWRTTYDGSSTAVPIGLFVSTVLEPTIRREQHVSAGDTIRVALLRSERELVWSTAFHEGLKFNGKGALANGDDFREFVFDEFPTEQSARAPRRELAGFAPHVVVNLRSDALVGGVIAPLERDWRLPHRPYYVAATPLAESTLEFIGTNPDRRKRFFGLASTSNTRAGARFMLHYNGTFGTSLAPSLMPSTSYDAFYIVAYASYAAGNEPASGPALAQSIGRLIPPGVPIEVGPTEVFEGYRTLRDGGRIDLTGASGRMDYDATTGEAAVDFAVLCVRPAAQTKQARDAVESGLVYDSRSGRLEGALKCP